MSCIISLHLHVVPGLVPRLLVVGVDLGSRVSGVGRVARRAGRLSVVCCPCCGLDFVGGNDNICGGVFVTGWV